MKAPQQIQPKLLQPLGSSLYIITLSSSTPQYPLKAHGFEWYASMLMERTYQNLFFVHPRPNLRLLLHQKQILNMHSDHLCVGGGAAWNIVEKPLSVSSPQIVAVKDIVSCRLMASCLVFHRDLWTTFLAEIIPSPILLLVGPVLTLFAGPILWMSLQSNFGSKNLSVQTKS